MLMKFLLEFGLLGSISGHAALIHAGALFFLSSFLESEAMLSSEANS